MPKYFISKEGQVYPWSYDLALGTMVSFGVSGSVASESMRIAEKLLNEHKITAVYSVAWILLSEEIRRGNLSKANELVISMKGDFVVETVPRSLPKIKYFQILLGLARVVDLVRIIGEKKSAMEKLFDANKINRDQWLLDLLAMDLGINNSDISDLINTNAFSFSSDGTISGKTKKILVEYTDKWRSTNLENSLGKMGFDLDDLSKKNIIDSSENTIDSVSKTLFSQNITPFSKEESLSELGENPRTGGDPRVGANVVDNTAGTKSTTWEQIKKVCGYIWGAIYDSKDDSSDSPHGGIRGTPDPEKPYESPGPIGKLGDLWELLFSFSDKWRLNPKKRGQPMPYGVNKSLTPKDYQRISSSRLTPYINWGTGEGGLSGNKTGTPPKVDPPPIPIVE